MLMCSIQPSVMGTDKTQIQWNIDKQTYKGILECQPAPKLRRGRRKGEGTRGPILLS